MFLAQAQVVLIAFLSFESFFFLSFFFDLNRERKKEEKKKMKREREAVTEKYKKKRVWCVARESLGLLTRALTR